MVSEFYIGIDPGKDGAMAIIDNAERVTIFPYKDAGEVAYINVCYQLKGKSKCVLEEVHSMPGNGNKSMFSFGENYGFIKGILQSFGVPYETVKPQRWKKEFNVTADKKTSIKAAHRLFPDVDLRRNERCKKEHDGMAEALLLAEWARRHMK